MNGTSTSTALFNAVLDNEISLNNYILKIKKNSGTISANSVQFFLYTTGDTSNQNISVTPILSSSKTTLSSNAYTVERIVIPAETTLTDVELEVMISETEKQYEPYGASPSPDYPSEVESCGDNGSINEVICNKNLFDKNTTTDGKYIDGNGSIQTQSNIMYSDYIQIKTNINYYITGRSEWSSVALYDKNKTFLERILTTQPNGVLNITNSNCKYIIINALLTNKDTLQLEEGSTATSYEEHQSQSYTIPTQQPFRAIGNVRDKFILKENGKWYERHPIFRKIFTGNETFNLQSINDYGIANFDYKTGNTGYQVNGNILCNRFITQTAGISSIKTEGIYMNWGDVIFIRILASEIDTVEKLKTWLATLYTNGTPVYADYVLEEPLDIECTEEQIQQLENKPSTYKEMTIINSEDETPAYLEVAGIYDLNNLINN